MKISGVNISGGIRMHQQAAPTPSGPSKFVVGAYKDDDAGSSSGSVYVYNTDGTGEVKVTASDGAASDLFGYSVAMSDTKVVVGAFNDDAGRGSAYVYNTDGTGELKIVSPVAATSDQFGYSVAVSDTKVVVGAYNDDAARGSVYVYNLDGTGEVKITASDGATSDQFGYSVAVSDTKIVVGSIHDDDPSNSGSVYVYNLDGTGELKIQASDGATSDQFGVSVAMSDTKIVVGASGDDDAGSSSGSAYVYNTDGTGEQKITASDHAAGDNFGLSVAMSDTKIVVGAFNDDSARGSAYVYNTDGTGEQKIQASDGATSDNFGYTVAIQGDKVIVGAWGDDDSGDRSGSVYVYNLDGTGEQKIVASDGASGDQFGRSVALN
jgi:hypothetical protein